MMALWPPPFVLLVFIGITLSKVIEPSISNSSGDYYINSVSTPSNFQSDVILCKSSNCYIICDVEAGCFNTTIDGTESSVITLKCLKESSCFSLNLINGSSNTANIYCSNIRSCQWANININITNNVYIECDSNQTSATRGDYAACDSTQFNVNNSHHVNFTFGVYDGYIPHIWGTSITGSLTLSCIEQNSCHYLYVYCPDNAKCNIYCPHIFSCFDMQVYFKDNHYKYLNLNCNASDPTSCQYLEFKCTKNEAAAGWIYNYTAHYWECAGYDCCPYRIGNITCLYDSNDTDCIIDCSEQSCIGKDIYGMNASSLTLICNEDNVCSGSNIECPYGSNIESCNIICSESWSCRYATINVNANSTNILNISCVGQQSCQGLWINGNNNYVLSMDLLCYGVYGCLDIQSHDVLIHNEFNILCTNKLSCWSIDINLIATDATYGNITCNNGTDATYGNRDGACYMAFFAIGDDNGDSNISVICNQYNDCKNATFNFTEIDNVYVYCNGVDSCNYTRFYGSDSNLFNIYCKDMSCSKSMVYCPYLSLNTCSINCVASNDCFDGMVVYVPNDYKYGYLDLNVAANQSTLSSIAELNFICTNIDMSNSPNKKSINYLYNNITHEYQCKYDDVHYCCPWTYGPNIVCNENEDCKVNCSASINCRNGYIDGSLANSLNVTCNNDMKCSNLLIVCPINKQCNINCYGYKSCYSASINYYGGIDDDESNINILCNDYDSCYNATIYVSYISIINIASNGNINGTVIVYAEYANHINVDCVNCDNFNIHGEYAKNINITCHDIYGCVGFDIYANYTNNVSLTAIGDYAWYNNTIYAFNADNVYLICSSYSSCSGGNFYIPSSGLTLNCYGFGCYNIGNFYVSTYIENAQFYINGCNKCKSLEKCITSFVIYCDLYHSLSNIYYNHSDQFNGLMANCSANNCGCDVLLKQANHNFINDDTDSICPYSSSSNHDNWILYIIITGCIAGCIVAIIIIYLVFRFCKKRQLNKKHGPLLPESIN